MYVPEPFAIADAQSLDLVRAYPLGVLVTHGASGLDANHIPFELQADTAGKLTLHGHVARANPVWQEAGHEDPVLVVFRAADAYISPNWYPSKHALHRQVPTWNYMVVHAHGKMTVRDDERYVRGVVARLTRTHEAGQPKPWKMTDSAPDYIDAQLRAIVGIQIEVTRIVGKHKLGQNKARDDRESAGRAVREQGAHVLGDAMLADTDSTS